MTDPENKKAESWTPTEKIKETINEPENELEKQRELGECRIHPPTPIPITSKDGKNPIGTQIFGGNKPIVVYEHPQCTGGECQSHWCPVHQECINVCKYDHNYSEENNENE